MGQVPALCHSDSQKLILDINASFEESLSERPSESRRLPTTLNQRVQGSSPCAPTKLFNDINR
jgi:hypothetical protein